MLLSTKLDTQDKTAVTTAILHYNDRTEKSDWCLHGIMQCLLALQTSVACYSTCNSTC